MKRALAFFLLVCSHAAQAATPAGPPAALDPSFGVGGVQFTDFAVGSFDMRGVTGLAVQPDGKIVVVGTGAPSSRLARFNTDGTLDLSFNRTGFVLLTPGSFRVVGKVAVQADGRILVAGGRGFDEWVLFRFNADGTPDDTFSPASVRIGQSGIAALAIQADGKIVATGTADGSGGDFGVVRYNVDGSLDTSFGGNGIVVLPVGAGSSRDLASALAIQPDGKIVLGGSTRSEDGSSYDNSAIARLNGDGSLDTSFNGTGLVIADFFAGGYDGVVALRVAPDGKVVAATNGTAGFAFVRFNANGTPDITFNGTGRAVYNFAPAAFGPSDIAILPDGRIVGVGYLSGGSNSTYALVVRLTAAGAVDTSFGNGNGTISTPQDATSSLAAVALLPDGRIVAGGHTGETRDFLVMRLDAAGTALDASFGSSGIARLKVVYRHNVAYGVAVQSDGRIVAAGDTLSGMPSPISLARYGSDGTLDASFGSGGRVMDTGPSPFAAPAPHASGVSIQSDGRIVVAGSVFYRCVNITCLPSSSFLVSRYTAAGAPESSRELRTQEFVGENFAVARAVRIQGDGKIVAAGFSRRNIIFEPPGKNHFVVARLNPDLSLDTGFNGSGSIVTTLGGGDAEANALAIQADGKILAAGYAHNGTDKDFALVRYTATGGAEVAFVAAIGGGTDDVAYAMAIQADGKILLGGSSGTNTALARFSSPGVYDTSFAAGGKFVVPGAEIVAIAIQPDGKVLALTRDFNVWRLTAAGAPDGTFADNGRFTLAMGAGSAASSMVLQADGRIVVAGNADGGIDQDFVVARIVPGERSLVTHYYRSILRRDPDSGGKAFWDGEASRMSAIGANVNEIWFALAQTFYTSPEYAALNRDNTGYATDLYNTFFNRPPDSGGLAYWKGQLDSGMPREVLLAQFMFSPEFAAFAQAIFGNPAVRAEVNAVLDFYRGILGRLPDDGGFAYWVGRFRTAQCQGQAAIVSEVEAISSAFTLSGEYASRGRANAQYVGDMYNAFLRRGGDLTGVQYWIDQIATGARTREQVRVAFRNSPEFQARVNAIVQQGCLS